MINVIWFTIVGLCAGWLANIQLEGGKSRLAADLASALIGSVLCGILVMSLKSPAFAPGVAAEDVALAAAGGFIGVFVQRVSRSQRKQ